MEFALFAVNFQAYKVKKFSKNIKYFWEDIIMKSRLKLLTAIALFLGGCTTGSMVSSGYVDDIYYSPGDNPPPVVAHTTVTQPTRTTPQREQVVSNINESASGKTVDNYVLKDGSSRSYGNVDEYYYNDQPDYADTTYYYDDDSVKYVINNYYEPSDNMSYSSRIRRFQDPYFYDPYWDSYMWDPYYYGPSWRLSMSWGFGWGHSWYDPWYYGGWGYPYYSYGYSPWYYGGWGYPYYGYYGGWGYPSYGWGGSIVVNPVDRYHGRRNYTGRQGGSNAINYGGSGINRGQALGRSIPVGSARSSAVSTQKDAVSSGRNYIGGAGATGTRLQGTRPGTTSDKSTTINSGTTTTTRTATSTRQSGTYSGVRNSQVQTNLRRGTSSSIRSGSGTVMSRPRVQTQETTRTRSSVQTTTTTRRYTPSYSKPRMNTRATYNNSSTRQYTRPSSTSSGTSRYSKPSSTSGTRSSAVRSSSSYQRGSSSSSNYRSGSSSGSYRSSGSSYRSSGSSSSSGRSYSTPSSSGGGSRSSGSSGGSYSGRRR